MKIKDEQKIKLWVDAEKALTMGIYPEQMRTSGLLSALHQGWPSALLRLEEAVRNGVNDLQTLDALGEAAYKAYMLEALIPFEHLYRDPLVAIHLARAYMILGQIELAREFVNLAKNSLLKSAIQALLGVEKNIETAMNSMFSVVDNDPEIEKLNLSEFWQALAPIADAAGRKDLVLLAERRSKALAYAKPIIHYNQALRLLAEGELRAGWKLYESRLIPGSPCADATAFVEFSMWEGEFIENEKLLVIMENGFGDQIFSLRYIKELIKNGYCIEVAICAELLELAQFAFPEIVFHDLSKAKDSDYWSKLPHPDYWCYAMSIPARADMCNLICTGGYLKAPPVLTANYQKIICAANNLSLPIYGIVWHGDIRTAPMRTRAYSLQEFLHETKILKSPCIVVCLQKDVTAEEFAQLQFETQKANCIFIDASVTLTDFSHTAAWMNCLDHMLSCDTATAHLAGALGIESTILIRNKAIWHWICDDKQKSLWYDSAQIKYALTPTYAYMFDIRP